MSHPLLRRVIMIVGLAILGIGAMIPIVAFAKTSNQTSAAVRWSSKTTVAVTQECILIPQNPGRQVIGTFNKNVEVSGTAVMTSGDVPGETFQEGLVLIESNGPFTKLILANSGPQRFEFTARSNGDQLTACFATIGHDDDADVTPPTPTLSDHTGSVTFRTEH